MQKNRRGIHFKEEFREKGIQSNIEKELKKAQELLGKERNLDQISFYEGYIKGLRFRKEEEEKLSNNWEEEFYKMKGLTPSQEAEVKFFIEKSLEQQRNQILEFCKENKYYASKGEGDYEEESGYAVDFDKIIHYIKTL